jgi:hypothetical protein
MGLRSGGGSLAVVGSCSGGAVLEVPLDGGDGVVVTVSLGGGGGGHTANPDSRESGLASLAPILGVRVPVGRPSGLIQIHVVYLYNDLGGVDSGIGMTSTGSSSLSTTATTITSSSSSSVTPSPSPSLGNVNIGCLCATRYGNGVMPWMAQGGSR